MKKIYKYVLLGNDFQEVVLPEGAEVIAIQAQHGSPCLWAIVDPSAKTVTRTFRTIGTGQQIEADPGKHLGTYQLNDGGLVFHVFEEEKCI